MSVLKKNSARQRDQERARLIWLLTTDKAVTSTLLGKLTLAEQYDVGTLADDIAEVGALVAHLPPPDLADTLEALPSKSVTPCGGWCRITSAGRCCLRPRKTSGTT
jgi:magnesium transporter